MGGSMWNIKTGVFADCFRLGVRDGIRKAAQLGAQGVQVYTTAGELAPENISASKRREFVKFVNECSVVISATCADYGEGFIDTARNRELIPKVKANIDLAVDLGVTIITTHIGHVPENEKLPVWNVLIAALNDIGKHADKRNVVLATETGPESGAVLAKLIKKLDTRAVRVNFDPANLVMGCFDHLQAVRDLAPYIVHTHAKDGKRGNGEVALGKGDVDFPRYLSVLKETGFDGFFTIEREVGENPESDIKQALSFLKEIAINIP
jgi:L-ribulose-5-phosphate 3-epimerase